MTENSSSNRSQLEMLPDELFLEIFNYVDPIDVCSFFGLNKRLNNIVHDVKLNIIIQCQEEEDLQYLTTFSPAQFIKLEMYDYCSFINFHTMTELRSLTVDCTYLSREQLDQVSSAVLPHLERLWINNVPYDLREELLYIIADGEHFPSLQICQLKLRHIYNIDISNHHLQPKNTIRSLTIEKWSLSEFGPLLSLMPSLNQFEANFEGSFQMDTASREPHETIENLRVTLGDPFDDLQTLLRYTPNLTRLHIRGKLKQSSAYDYFNQLTNLLRSLVPRLAKFDCELHFHSLQQQVIDFTGSQMHPLFRNIRRHFGGSRNWCFATRLKHYPFNNEYEYMEPPRFICQTYNNDRYNYDSDDYYYRENDDDYNDGFIDYGLGYRGNYKANYGSSPWSGNND